MCRFDAVFELQWTNCGHFLGLPSYVLAEPCLATTTATDNDDSNWCVQTLWRIYARDSLAGICPECVEARLTAEQAEGEGEGEATNPRPRQFLDINRGEGEEEEEEELQYLHPEFGWRRFERVDVQRIGEGQGGQELRLRTRDRVRVVFRRVLRRDRGGGGAD